MGDPKKRRKKYSKPAHPWQKERIDEEKALLKEHGLKNKQEIWRADSLLRNFKRQAKRLITLSTKQSEVESQQLLERLNSLGLLEKKGKIEDVLSIELKDVLDRRLQTLVYKKKLSRSIGQARQFITHRHVAIGDKIMSVPSYLVSIEEEKKINFRSTSSLSNQDHPERAVVEEKTVPKKEKKATKKTEEKKKEAKETKKAEEPKKTEEKKKEAKETKKAEEPKKEVKK